jgi:hypothetical protein
MDVEPLAAPLDARTQDVVLFVAVRTDSPVIAGFAPHEELNAAAALVFSPAPPRGRRHRHSGGLVEQLGAIVTVEGDMQVAVFRTGIGDGTYETW